MVMVCGVGLGVGVGVQAAASNRRIEETAKRGFMVNLRSSDPSIYP